MPTKDDAQTARLDRNGSVRLTRWYKATELPREVFSVWQKANGALSPVAIVATVDADGAPRSAPFGSLRAINPCLLRFSPTRFQTTYANLCRDGRVTVTMVAAPNIAVSVRGRARVVRERMAANENRAVVDIDIAEVKNDMVSTIVIENGISVSAREEFRERFQSLAAEIEGVA